MSHECKIYVLFDRSRRVNYIGRTARPIEKRMYEHKKVLGFSPQFRVIDHCSEDCAEVEKKWITYYRERGFELRNVAYGQGPHFLSDASRIRLSLAFTGRPVTWGDKISAAQKGVPKNWSVTGRKRVESSQFKKGHSTFASLPVETQRSIRRQASEKWDDPARAERMIQGIKDGSWKGQSDEHRGRHAANLSASLKGNPKLIKAASKGGKANFGEHPDRASRSAKKFWQELRTDPALYQEYIDRRAVAISKAKLAKKAL